MRTAVPLALGIALAATAVPLAAPAGAGAVEVACVIPKDPQYGPPQYGTSCGDAAIVRGRVLGVNRVRGVVVIRITWSTARAWKAVGARSRLLMRVTPRTRVTAGRRAVADLRTVARGDLVIAAWRGEAVPRTGKARLTRLIIRLPSGG